MPSLVTSRSNATTTTGGSRPLSKVNSFKRDWGNEDEENKLRGSSGAFDWSPSPEQKKMKAERPTSPPPAVPTLPTNLVETAADRRRKAILAALQPNADLTPQASSTSSFSSAAPTASTGALYGNGRTLVTLSDDEGDESQALPSIPERPRSGAGSSQVKKRSYPWNESVLLAKKAMSKNDSGAGPSGIQRPASAGSSGSRANMNIKQKVVLSTEQQQVLAAVVGEGKNLFFTGSAGTGKSVLLREIISSLRKKYATAPDAVAVTASTGIAACNIGGVTLHSFGGAGLATDEVKILVNKIRKQKKSVARWVRTKVLIIDEISMVDGEMFDKFCKIGQTLRKNDRPWGGIQIIVTGDFFQLPPVTKQGAVPRFCFEAATWRETIHMSVNLSKVFRQKDQRFVDMLNEMRFGQMTQSTIQAFKGLSRPIKYNDGIEPTELFPRREDVDRANNTRLKQLNTDGWSYTATDGGAVTDPVQREKLLSSFLAPKYLALQVDAQVMLIKNTDETLVNGSMGKVVGFCHKIAYESDQQGRWLQDRGWGQLDDDERERKEAALQIALSKLQQGAKELPVVRFSVPGGGIRDMLVDYESFKSELPNGEVQASRTQLPLILAWAMSIHKSQGQTLDRVKVDLGKVFEKGQAYVALSRATSLEGLQVTGFTASKVMAHRKVTEWSKTLKGVS